MQTPYYSYLEVSVSTQTLRCYMHKPASTQVQPACVYPVSTAARGAGCIQHSYCTPLGRHVIRQKLGHGQPAGMVFEDRQPVCLYTQHPEAGKKGLITSRILWLGGLEPGYNQGLWASPDACQGQSCDSYERYIYIHGTGLEEQIGTPFSCGCINMRNRDVISLFDAVHEDITQVNIIS